MIIYSGGQTGVDRAGWDAAKFLGLKQTGWVPKGRLAEDGVISPEYECSETDSSDYVVRTEKNLVEAEATVILTFGTPTGGTLLTFDLCKQHNRPFILVDLDQINFEKGIANTLDFLKKQSPKTLNIAGPRASKGVDVYFKAKKFLITLLKDYLRN